MSVFIFQANPKEYDLRRAIQPGRVVTWRATRYRNEMHEGDAVYLWLAGEPDIRGLYGLGRLKSQPYIKNDWETHGVDLEYTVRFGSHIPAEAVESEPSLAKMLILRVPQGGIFLLSADEASHLAEVVRNRNERVPGD
jgi:EVE domain